MRQCLALDQSHPPRRGRFATWVQVCGTILLVGYVLIAAGGGLRQQLRSSSHSTIDCDYRVQLLRGRLVSHLDRPQTAPSRSQDAGREFSTLLRETRDFCVDSASGLVDKLDRIKALHDRHQLHGQRDAEARQELLAL
ncbi:MAG: hypothetical protein V3V08_24095 [Nannocystaceae bacterium]